MRVEHQLDPSLRCLIEYSEATGWRVLVMATVQWHCIFGKDHPVPLTIERRIDTFSTDRVLFGAFDRAIGNEPGAILQLTQILIDDQLEGYSDPCLVGLVGEDFV